MYYHEALFTKNLLMKFIAKSILVSILAIAPAISLAQTEVSTVNGIDWSLKSQWPNVSMFDASAYNSSGSSYTEGESTGIIKIDDNSIISNVQIDSKRYGVVRLNKDLSTQWLTNIDGYPISIGMFNGNILVLTATEFSSISGISNEYTGYIIDSKTGRIIVSRNVYKGSDKFYEQPMFLYSPDGSFFKIAIRTSNFTRGTHSPLLMFKMSKVADDYFTTNEFKVLDFDNKLELKSTIKPVLDQGYFIGATTNKFGDVFLMTDYFQGYIKIARYENGKTTPTKVLQQTVSMTDAIFSNLTNNYMFTSKKDPLAVFFAGTYQNGPGDRELVVSKFDFKNGLVNSNTQVIDKPYIKELEKSYVPFNKKFSGANLGNKAEMKIRNVVENDGKLIVGLSSYTIYNPGNGGHSQMTAYDLLINIYDEKTDLKYQQIIPRSYSSFIFGYMGIGMHCDKNALYLTANNNKGMFGFKALYSQVDLSNGKILNITAVEKPNIKKSYTIDPYASFWFSNQFALSYIEEKGFIFRSADAHIQLLNY